MGQPPNLPLRHFCSLSCFCLLSHILSRTQPYKNYRFYHIKTSNLVCNILPQSITLPSALIIVWTFLNLIWSLHSNSSTIIVYHHDSLYSAFDTDGVLMHLDSDTSIIRFHTISVYQNLYPQRPPFFYIWIGIYLLLLCYLALFPPSCHDRYYYSVQRLRPRQLSDSNLK